MDNDYMPGISVDDEENNYENTEFLSRFDEDPQENEESVPDFDPGEKAATLLMDYDSDEESEESQFQPEQSEAEIKEEVSCGSEKPDEVVSEEKAAEEKPDQPECCDISGEFDRIRSRLDDIAGSISSQEYSEEIKKINSGISDINAKVSSLRKLADLHEDIETKLNNKINEYENNFYRRIVSPILVEMFDLQEDMLAEAALESTSEETRKVLGEYVDSMSVILKHYGVRVERVNAGDVYDSKIHKPLRAVPTSDKALDGTVEKVKKRLVHFVDDRIVERAGVFVYQYTENQEKNQENK